MIGLGLGPVSSVASRRWDEWRARDTFASGRSNEKRGSIPRVESGRTLTDFSGLHIAATIWHFAATRRTSVSHHRMTFESAA